MNFINFQKDVDMLNECGYNVDKEKYPFWYHHDYVLATNDTIKERNNISYYMSNEFLTKYGNETQIDIIRLGAILHLFKKYPLLNPTEEFQKLVTKLTAVYQTIKAGDVLY